MKKFKLLAPVEGKVIPIDQVPDPVFSQKMLGDGVAIIPKDGKIYSPIDGTVTNVMDSLHAYSFISDDGVEMIVHFLRLFLWERRSCNLRSFWGYDSNTE